MAITTSCERNVRILRGIIAATAIVALVLVFVGADLFLGKPRPRLKINKELKMNFF
jgi:hypothetical protein